MDIDSQHDPYLYRYLGVVDHKNCRCNVGHTKESNAEAIRILKSEPTLTIQKVSSFPLVHAIIVCFRNM